MKEKINEQYESLLKDNAHLQEHNMYLIKLISKYEQQQKELIECVEMNYKNMCKYCNAVDTLCKGKYTCNHKRKHEQLLQKHGVKL